MWDRVVAMFESKASLRKRIKDLEFLLEQRSNQLEVERIERTAASRWNKNQLKYIRNRYQRDVPRIIEPEDESFRATWSSVTRNESADLAQGGGAGDSCDMAQVLGTTLPWSWHEVSSR
jgi:hypothetical protein